MVNRQRVNRQVGSALRRIRLDRGFPQHMLAFIVGINPRQLSEIENGHRSPAKRVLEDLLTVLNCSGDEFGCWFGPWGNVEDLPRLGQAKHQKRHSSPRH
jgi:transcriptional regulator with XRE-family HTH domain